MPTPIVECIANYSDARRPEVVEAIAASIGAVPGVHVLDRHSDLDHNRTVITFAGPPGAVEEAAFRSIAKAAELINLDEHQGEHPRLGATDVVPFVPISGIDMEACVEMARRLGRRVGEELSIPVYLYEEAAARPERQNLENIRRGQYEALKTELGVKPGRDPDFGPPRVGPAGATVIGARPPLIAYNIYLTTGEVSIAKKIAKTIRYSSGGLRYVKGLGLLVEGRAQVSMNLTNFRGTPLALVVETIRREATRYGTAVHHSELVGLIPEEALIEAARWYLQLDQFEPEQILERRLQAALQDATAQEGSQPEAGVEVEAGSSSDAAGIAGRKRFGFLDDLAAGTASPGGGSAAAYSGASAAALAAMVARLTIGKKKYAGVEEEMRRLLDQAEAVREVLAELVDRDAAAFEMVMEAYRLPKSTPEEELVRRQAIERALLGAAVVPLEVARLAVKAMELSLQAAAKGNLTAISDGATGAALARAALTGAGYNVRINLGGLEDPLPGQPLLEELEGLERRAVELEEQVQAQLRERGGIVL
jgi:glutamate formiminotransferase/formiminotetrahydrofolate cyclodeaminase